MLKHYGAPLASIIHAAAIAWSRRIARLNRSRPCGTRPHATRMLVWTAVAAAAPSSFTTAANAELELSGLGQLSGLPKEELKSVNGVINAANTYTNTNDVTASYDCYIAVLPDQAGLGWTVDYTCTVRADSAVTVMKFGCFPASFSAQFALHIGPPILKEITNAKLVN